MITEKNVLANIIAIRKKKGLTQKYVAEQIGLEQPGYALIEKGDRGLELKRLFQIAIVFEVDVLELFTYPLKYSVQESNESLERVSVIFEVSPERREDLMRMVTGGK